MSNAHAYVGPSIAASGITFAQYQTGAECHLGKFITTYSAGIAAPTTAVTWSATGGGSSGGSLVAGTYYCVVTASDGIDETTPNTVSSQITVAAGDQPEISAFPTAPTGATSWNLYLTAPGGASTGPFHLYQMGIASTASTLVLTAAAPTTSDSAMQPPATNGTVWSADKLQLAKYVDTGQLQKVFAWHRRVQTAYSKGDPMSFKDCVQKTRDSLLVYALLQAAALEGGAIIVANPGHLSTAGTGIGGNIPQRVWP